MGVLMNPGQMQLTLMPNCARSLAADFVKEMTPPLDAL